MPSQPAAPLVLAANPANTVASDAADVAPAPHGVHGLRKAAVVAGIWGHVAGIAVRTYRNPLRAARAQPAARVDPTREDRDAPIGHAAVDVAEVRLRVWALLLGSLRAGFSISGVRSICRAGTGTRRHAGPPASLADGHYRDDQTLLARLRALLRVGRAQSE